MNNHFLTKSQLVKIFSNISLNTCMIAFLLSVQILFFPIQFSKSKHCFPSKIMACHVLLSSSAYAIPTMLWDVLYFLSSGIRSKVELSY